MMVFLLGWVVLGLQEPRFCSEKSHFYTFLVPLFNAEQCSHFTLLFRCVCKIAKSDLIFPCLYIPVEQLGSHWTDFREI